MQTGVAISDNLSQRGWNNIFPSVLTSLSISFLFLVFPTFLVASRRINSMYRIFHWPTLRGYGDQFSVGSFGIYLLQSVISVASKLCIKFVQRFYVHAGVFLMKMA